MDEQQMAEYFAEHAVDGELPQDEMVKLLTGAADADAVTTGDDAEPEQEPESEGSTAPQAEAEEQPPADAADKARAVEAAQAADEAMAAQVRQLADEVAVLKGMGVGQPQPVPQQEQPQEEAEDDGLARLREDWPEVADAVDGITARHRERISALEAQIAALQPATEQMAAERMVARHYAQIDAAHPDAGQVFGSQEYGTWLAAQPAFMREIFEAVQQRGTAEQVIQLLDGFKQANPAWGKAPEPEQPTQEDDAARQTAAVQAAKAKAKAAAPRSLSDIPGGAAVETDATEALMQMGPGARLDRIMSMSPDKIEEMLRRAV